MIINKTQINRDNLMTKAEILDCLRANGEDGWALSHIYEHYYNIFGNELVWRYPISDGKHLGVFIVIAREGFLSVPYDSVDCNDGELLKLSDATMFDADDFEFFIKDWRSFSEDLVSAMSDMQRILRDN